jgi:hypothetical protein
MMTIMKKTTMIALVLGVGAMGFGKVAQANVTGNVSGSLSAAATSSELNGVLSYDGSGSVGSSAKDTSGSVVFSQDDNDRKCRPNDSSSANSLSLNGSVEEGNGKGTISGLVSNASSASASLEGLTAQTAVGGNVVSGVAEGEFSNFANGGLVATSFGTAGGVATGVSSLTITNQ